SAKRARTADEEVRHAHTTATATTTGPISSFAETFISEALARVEVYRSFATALDSELARFSVVSPAHAREAGHLARTITAALQKSSVSSPPTPDSTVPADMGKGPVTFAEIAAKGANSASASRSRSTTHTSGSTRKDAPPPTSSQSDGRVFLRLDRGSSFADTDAFAIRKEV
ncbi:hypothetical protein N0V85_009307, partial [Neurospora sp. IMI 360204]